MSDSQTTVAKNSARSEIQPSVVCESGAVDRLNEAPDCVLCGTQAFVEVDGLIVCEDCAESMIVISGQVDENGNWLG